jgi:hypothetical protein
MPWGLKPGKQRDLVCLQNHPKTRWMTSHCQLSTGSDHSVMRFFHKTTTKRAPSPETLMRVCLVSAYVIKVRPDQRFYHPLALPEERVSGDLNYTNCGAPQRKSTYNERRFETSTTRVCASDESAQCPGVSEFAQLFFCLHVAVITVWQM